MNQALVTCPGCGARLLGGLSCGEQLGAMGVWGFGDSELMAEHFLTVASYNLQHPAQFTDEALAGLRAAFIAHLDHGLSVKEIRRRNAQAYNGKRRVLKNEAE